MAGWLVFLTVMYSNIARKARFIFSEKNPKSLGNLIEEYLVEVRKVKIANEDLLNKVRVINKIARAGYHKIGFIRYNPFGDVGGNQSFSLCLLNAQNNGFILSSIHSREGTRVYAKTVSGGVSEYNLSEEEKKVIEKAKGGEN